MGQPDATDSEELFRVLAAVCHANLETLKVFSLVFGGS
jgi:hypothetical protein